MNDDENDWDDCDCYLDRDPDADEPAYETEDSNED